MNRSAGSVWIVSLVGAFVFLAFTPTARATENPLEQKVTKFKLDQLPPAVRATIEKESAGGKVEEIEKETENGKTFYDVEIEKNGHESSVHVSEDGKVLARHAEDED